jgi:hypothetical protein
MSVFMNSTKQSAASCAAAIVVALVSMASIPPAMAADEPPLDAPITSAPERDVKSEVPIVAYAYQAAGAQAHAVGAQAYGLGSGAAGGVGDDGAKHGIVGGGVTVWGAPIDRLTLVGDAARNETGNFAPSAGAIVRLLGRANDGFSLGAIGKFKIDGFGVGPSKEIESEIEAGVLLSYAKYRWHVDLNAISGFGTGDDGEIDSEGRLRIGRDLASWVRIGIDGQARYRLSGDKKLAGNRDGDFAAGPQVIFSRGPLYGALTAGPSTMNVYRSLGWTAVATVGGATF